MASPQVIIGNSNHRFSGVTSTMLQTLPGISEKIPVAVLGHHHLPTKIPALKFNEFTKLCRTPLDDGSPRVFHARRNDEMIQALIAKKIFGAKIKTIFTTTAQRHHTAFTKWLMNQMDGLLTTCQAAGSYVEQKIDRIIPHGVDLERYHPPQCKDTAWKELGFPGDYGIGMFGRVRPQKGIDILVKAAIPVLQKDPAPTIIIAGETTPKFESYQKDLKEKIATAGLKDRIIFYGKRPSEELPKLFRGMTLVTALSRNEGFGLTILEAMASGCAVLASHAGAWQEIITEGEHGFTVPCGDIEQTTKCLTKLTRNPTRLREMGIEGREHVAQNYSVSCEVEALCDYYRSWQTT